MLVVSCGSGNQTAHETRITRVYESDDPHSILYDTGSSHGNLLVTDDEFLYLLSTGDNAVYVIDAETGDIAAIIEEGGPYTLKVVAPAGKELYSLATSFWDGGGPITRRVVVTTGGEVFDAYYDGDAFRNLEEEELTITKLIVRRLK